MAKLEDAVKRLEAEIRRQHSATARKKLKLAISIAASILITTTTITVSTVSYHRRQETREQQRIMLEQAKLAYTSSYNNIKKSISEGQFKKADEEAANLASKLEEETFPEAKGLLSNLKVYSAYIKKFRTVEDECENENFELAKKLNTMLVSELKKEQPKDDGYILFAFAEKKSSEIDAALRQINFEKERLSAYNGMLNQIKGYMNKDQFEEAKISNNKLEEIIKKEKHSFRYLTEKRDDAVDELASCTKTTDQQMKRLEEQMTSARAEFGAIQAKVSRGAYDGISDDVKDLAARIEKINYSKTKELIEEVKAYTFIKSVKVDAVYEKRLVKKEHNEAVLIEPGRTEKVLVKQLGLLSAPTLGWADMLFGGQESILTSLGVVSNERYVDKKIPAKYESVWKPAEYEDVLVSPEYYKKIKVHPYSSKEWVIEDNAPKKLEIKSERKQKESKKDINPKVNYSWGK